MRMRKVRPRELRDLLQKAADRGCELEYTRSGHIKISTPNGPYYCASTSSDNRAVLNIRAALRRRGVPV